MGGSSPIRISEYYTSGAFANGLQGIPTSGRFPASAFQGQSRIGTLFENLGGGATSNCRALYHFRLMNPNYTGPLVQVRRSTDNSNGDFYANRTGPLTSSNLGQGTTLTAWLGAGLGYVATWYDQSGRGNHLTQATTTQQPRIVQSNETYIYLQGSSNLAGPNVFPGSLATNMRIVFASREISRVANFLVSLNGNEQAAGPTPVRFSMHAPWTDSNWYFDAGNISTPLNNRAVGFNATAIGARTLFNGYKNATLSNNGFRLNAGGTVYVSSSNSPAEVTGGVRLNVSGYNIDHYMYGMAIFSSTLTAGNELVLEASMFTGTATGGQIINTGAYRIHRFTSNATFTVASNNIIADILVVGGGGGGGGWWVGGGGGGGGIVYNTDRIILPGTYTVTVGAGGAGGTANGMRGTNGGNSTFSNLTGTGGGGGGSYLGTGSASNSGLNGGCGGGTSFNGTPGTGSQGFNGGSQGLNPNRGGGGGGMGGLGGSNDPPVGGIGRAFSLGGSNVYFSGGGGAGSDGFGGSGGLGGGGNGGNGNGFGSTTPSSGTSGAANSGGGGGGGGGNVPNLPGGNGGSGVVLIRYPFFS